MAPAKVGECAPLTLDSADASESAVDQDSPAISAADPVIQAVAVVVTVTVTVAVPIRLRIPVTAKLEAEAVIPFAPAFMLPGFIFPVVLSVLPALDGRFIRNLTFTVVQIFLNAAFAPKLFIRNLTFTVVQILLNAALTPGLFIRNLPFTVVQIFLNAAFARRLLIGPLILSVTPANLVVTPTGIVLSRLIRFLDLLTGTVLGIGTGTLSGLIVLSVCQSGCADRQQRDGRNNSRISHQTFHDGIPFGLETDVDVLNVTG